MAQACPVENILLDPEDDVSLLEIQWQRAHIIGWAVSGALGLVAIALCFIHVYLHLKVYVKPEHQRYIVRISFVTFFYSVFSWLSYRFYWFAIYFQLIRDGYQAVVIVNFFLLLLQYLGDSDYQQHQRILPHKKAPSRVKFAFVLSFNPSKRHSLQKLKWGILQYAVILPLTTLVCVILETQNLYCQGLLSWRYGKLYAMIITATSGTIANLCLMALFEAIQARGGLPIPRLSWQFFCVDWLFTIIFVQRTILAIVAHFGYILATEFWSPTNISNGIETIIISVEMVLFAVIHIVAFPTSIYKALSEEAKPPRQPLPIVKAIIDSINPMDVLRETWKGMKYLRKLLAGHPVGHSKFDFVLGMDEEHLDLQIRVFIPPNIRRPVRGVVNWVNREGDTEG